MYVEFVGVPGAGKTTVAEQVRLLLEKSGVACTTRTNFFGPDEKRSYKSRWSLMNLPYLDLYALILWLRLAFRKRMSVAKTLTRIHEYQKLLYQLARAGAVSVSVWDNGFVQWFSNHVLAGVLDKEAAVTFIRKKLPIATLFVFVDTPVEEAVRRMQEREARLRATKGIVGWKPSAAEKEEWHRTFAESRHVQEALLNALMRLGIRTVHIDGTKLPRENATVVCEHIRKQL
jgi:thymidylate kinase